MALTPRVCSVNDAQGLRKASTFHRSLWGDFFLTYQPPTAPQHAYMTERSEVLKELVRKMLENANEIPKILDLIVTLQRLGLDNHYENEIDELLNVVYCSDYDSKDLNIVSLRFYLLRKNGYDVTSELAKLNFNLLQLLYCEELKNVTLWWKQLNLETNLSFIRDRLVEMHFWMTGACSEPKYSLARVITTKMTACITILDDIMDTYSTTEEGLQLAEAIYRWEENAAELLPEYMKGFYMYFLKTFDALEDELGPNKSYRVLYLKEVASILKMLVRGNSEEIRWRDEHYIPETINEHLELSGITVGAFQVAVSSFVGMGDIVTKEILDWLLTYPRLMKGYTTIARLSNDIASTKREQTGDHYASTVQCYMLQHGTTMHEACEEIKELIDDSWKDVMKAYVTTTTEQPKVVARTVVDFARTADYIYKKTDAFTFSHTIKDMIALLYLEPTTV
ncbi:hypothetical protein PR202_ga30618 [Eleusine coracana subsp. coracana]|uniref:Uncharacterized protein n=1 Tax=Eleusine coracana subsp. coracana TaxID=191504 RepID=A0AAV5DPB0_ELECO|nr:hypothetical protein PR202_ga30618 [Eleusine coracana subsp. coracana]